MDIHKTFKKLMNKENLSKNEAVHVMDQIFSGMVSPILVSSLLTSLKMKGETVDEILGFIISMRRHMTRIDIPNCIDTCGTGGDGKGTFNISTAAALVAVSCGVRVAKHGNRSASSLCGSADVLEALGVRIDLNSHQAIRLLKETSFTFLFAPLYHPEMKYVSGVRNELKIPTVFNLLGPFVNPATPKRQIIGVPTRGIAKKLSYVAIHLNYDHLLIVSGGGLDEIDISSKTYAFEIKKTSSREFIIDPRNFGVYYKDSTSLRGGDNQINARIIESVLSGKEGSYQDAVLINSAVALYVAGLVDEISQGISVARDAIRRGYACVLLQKVREVSNRV